MTNTYRWEITQLECYPDHEGQTDVVFNIGWARTAADGINEACHGGSKAVAFDPSAPFTPYDQLTKEQIISWLEQSLGAETIAAYDSELDKQLAYMANPPVISPGLPWN